jgi:hypothetical protein
MDKKRDGNKDKKPEIRLFFNLFLKKISFLRFRPPRPLRGGKTREPAARPAGYEDRDLP